ncbi:hypothetical protein ACIBBB_29085 [Streptomyces sp. NPDC051217]|uniref:hypothetical protein n=1 Tax=Streptomyces sp. NPDC051217 TaxID=3365644 RepID=UPI00379D0E75
MDDVDRARERLMAADCEHPSGALMIEPGRRIARLRAPVDGVVFGIDGPWQSLSTRGRRGTYWSRPCRLASPVAAAKARRAPLSECTVQSAPRAAAASM